MTPPLDVEALSEPRVRELAQRAGIRLDHPSQLAFLTAVGSVDVQAGPGSGKTTLTSLKLCAIARGWRSLTKGVCVLSHTNVAKDQITERLQNDRFGRGLLRPPHFIGTIQSFVDTFLGLPYARSHGLDVRFIDNEAYSVEALRRLSRWGRLSTLRTYLSHQWDGGEAVAQSGTYKFDDSEGLLIQPEWGKFLAGPTAKSYREYVDLKESMAADGYFRFEDMYGFARQLLHEHPEMGVAVAARFPWVVIDEMQDTSADQQALVERILPTSRSVVQRIGDENQRILGDVDPGSFPGPEALELPVSRRFGADIARVVSSLTMSRPQDVIGSPERDDDQLLIILFDEDTASEVTSRFVQEAESSLSPAELEAYPLRAVAGRTRPSDAHSFPRTVLSYVPDYRPKATVAAVAATSMTLIDAVRTAQHAAAKGTAQEAVAILWGSLATVAGLCSDETASGRMTGMKLRRMLRMESAEAELDTRRLLRHLLEDADTESGASWAPTVQRVRDWHIISRAGYPEAAAAHCSYAAHSVEAESVLSSPTLPPSITISTIHGVKGETHSGTLLLECLTRSGKDHDLPQALRLITKQTAPDQLSGAAKEVCQLAFVAASRPRSLLALAVLANHAEPYLTALRAQGWRIVDVRDHPQAT